MRPKAIFTITPQLPEPLANLRELAHNVYFSWDDGVWDLFRRLDRKLWEQTGHNPVKILGQLSQERLDAISENEGYLAHLDRAYEGFRHYMDEPRWFQKNYRQYKDLTIAYFSAEYGLTECLPIYSGGLGVLSGDHLKTASDLGIPLVAVGLLYRNGYFHQALNTDGWQQERYDDLDFYTLPMELVTGDDGQPVIIDVPCLLRPVQAQIWRVNVGRVPLYLLDANLEQNDPEDRRITGQLYGGDREMRVRQEIMLGMGGYLALEALGIKPDVCHMNEGHSAFLNYERVYRIMQNEGVSLPQAIEAARASNCFTTHTPVPAGNDVFHPSLMENYFKGRVEELGYSWDQFMDHGRINPDDDHEPFGMTTLALRTSRQANGVSKLHGSVSRDMWKEIWPELPVEEVPIDHVTNGVHIYTWISPEMANLFDRYLGPEWRTDPQNPEIWERVYNIPDEELWRTHERRRERLVAYARYQLSEQYRKRGASSQDTAWATEILDPEALTIGFARRFATYKRATLLFRDLDRLKSIIAERECEVQFVFAGKAHPADNNGKQFIRDIIHAIREDPLRHRFVFIEDYDMSTTRNMVQGCDIWLNNPRRPLEASGTSGMKASANGVLNLSVLDGWWDEGYQPDNGWIIGNGEVYPDPEHQDRVEADSLYQILEDEIIPTFASRGRAGVPRAWVQRMKSAIATIVPQFCAHRMLAEYVANHYVPAGRSWLALTSDGFKRAGELAEWRDHVKRSWDHVEILNVDVACNAKAVSGSDDDETPVRVGDQVDVTAKVRFGKLAPRDLLVECYHGHITNEGAIAGGIALRMELQSTDDHGVGVYHARFACETSGRYGATVRCFPFHKDLGSKAETHLIQWA